MAKVVLPKSGPPGPYLSAKSGPTLPKMVRYSFNEFVLNKTRKACPSISEENVPGLIAGSVYTISGVHNRFFSRPAPCTCT